MPFTIFYSWQSKTDRKYNWNFIEDCLKAAVKDIRKNLNDDGQTFYISRDTKDDSGIPNIPTTLEAKIKVCDVFVADLTFIKPVTNDIPAPKLKWWERIIGRAQRPSEIIEDDEGVPAPNVSQEVGIALGSTTTEARIITVMNEVYGMADKLPFDLKQRRFPIRYHLDAKTTPEQKSKVKQNLIEAFKEIITSIYFSEHERQKAHFYPFETWRTWGDSFSRPFEFELTNYIEGVFSAIRGVMKTRQSIFRICGLPGIGKTRILYECFKLSSRDEFGDLTGRILYVDTKESEDKNVTAAVKKLLQQNEDKILVVDNCIQEQHVLLTRLVTHENSQMRLITVSSNPEERVSQLDAEQRTQLIILNNLQCKDAVNRIIEKNFEEFDKTERELLVDFSSGIPLVATIMIHNKERGKHQPGSLHTTGVVERLLGPMYEDPNTRAVIVACSLFSHIGYFDDLSQQADMIALHGDLCSLSFDGVHSDDLEEMKRKKFRQVCEVLSEHQLLERRGRTYALRPSPLAVRMAEDWWGNCTLPKFARILPELRNARLVESFCEQFRYLKHIEHARNVVSDLCDTFFSNAEVLNTNVGSRLFRTFVDVNPGACIEALYIAFADYTEEDYGRIVEGRRNLVWALERLCFRPETYYPGSCILAAFSISENENIANNATRQFLQLFHIFLPGTAVDFSRRFSMIEYCLAKDTSHRDLALNAISSALRVDSFHRVGGAEDQGDIEALKDYEPSVAEIRTYWANCINVLSKFIEEDNDLAYKSAEIVLANTYALCSVGAGDLILPALESVIGRNILDKTEIYKQVKFIIHSDRVYNDATVNQLKKILYEFLLPNNFSEKFQVLVKSPGYDEYYPEGDRENRGVDLQSKIGQLSIEFLEQKELWEQNIEILISGSLQEGYLFGKALVENGERDQLVSIIDMMKVAIESTDPTIVNETVLLAIMVHLNERKDFDRYFTEFLTNERFGNLLFSIARAKQLEYEYLTRMVGQCEKGQIPISQFGHFIYGWGIKHLPNKYVRDILIRINGIGEEGKVIALMLMVTWSHQNEVVFENYHDLIRQLVLENSTSLFNGQINTMDLHYFGDAVCKLLFGTADVELAKSITSLIVEQINKLENYYSIENIVSKILEVLLNEYFSTIWPVITYILNSKGEYGLAAWHFKDLLGSRHDSMRESEGLLFHGTAEKFEQIYSWCKDHSSDPALLWIAGFLPVFNNVRAKSDNWHPYAKKFIDTFGDNISVLNSIEAKMNTYSWMGSIVPKLESDKMLFETLSDHIIPSVKEWAKGHIEELDKRIKYEINKDEDGIV